MSLGDVQAFIQYSRQFTQPLTQVASMANLLQSGRRLGRAGLRAARRRGAGARRRRAAPAAGRAARRGRASSTCRSRYDPDAPADRGPLAGRRSPGQTVAIVGPTGAGKTTLVNLVMRFYERRRRPDHPRRRRHRRDAARRRCAARSAWCCRTPGCSRGTIRDNIAYGRPDATEDEILEAARATFVDRFVHSLPDGYDTVIDEEGSNLSAPASGSWSPSPGRSWPTRRC